MRQKCFYFGVSLLILFGFALPSHAGQPLVLYDDFNTKQINPEKWFGYIHNAFYAPDNLRMIQPSISALFNKVFWTTPLCTRLGSLRLISRS